jgi:hypothetical protein
MLRGKSVGLEEGTGEQHPGGWNPGSTRPHSVTHSRQKFFCHRDILWLLFYFAIITDDQTHIFCVDWILHIPLLVQAVWILF